MSKPVRTEVWKVEAAEAQTERLIAELASLGTLGLEERDGHLLAYFDVARDVAAQIRALADPTLAVHVSGPELVPDTDWEREWRAGLAPRRIGPLWIRPSWYDSQGTPEIILDPEQAFGSGEHATTRLALQLVLEAQRPGDRLLDVGSGSGILSLGALRLGAGFALGVDIETAACKNAYDNAQRNQLPFAIACTTPAALRADARFDVVVANMLLHRLEPWLGQVLGHASRVVVLSGYLKDEASRLDDYLIGSGWETRREIDEAQSGDLWCARLLHQSADLQ